MYGIGLQAPGLQIEGGLAYFTHLRIKRQKRIGDVGYIFYQKQKNWG
jgi:hypothetical protein